MNDENYSFLGKSALMPQEETLEIKKHRKSLSIGVPQEVLFEENRVALVPGAVNLLVENGHKVLVESNAGKAAKFSDKDYSEAGAQLVYSKEEVFQTDILVKIAPLSKEELEMLKPRQCLFSAIHYMIQNKEFFQELMKKKITAFSSDWIKDNDSNFPVLRSLSEISGNACIFIAAEYLRNIKHGKGAMFGSIPGVSPTEVVIIGAGTVATYAAKAAKAFGAIVKIFDNSVYRLRRIQQELNEKVFTSILQPKVMQRAFSTADVVIGAVHSVNGRTPCLVSDNLVSKMKDGSIIIDVSIDQGGCFETSEVTTHSKPVFVKHGVTHYCVPNIASMFPQTASYALSNFFAPLLIEIGNQGGVESLLKRDNGLRNGVYLYNGILTNKNIADHFQLSYRDLDLLIAAIH